MRSMKKCVLSAILFCLQLIYCFFPPPLSVNAVQGGDYACILSDSAFFYASPSESNPLFLIPKTYYVKVLNYAPDYSKIEYLYDGEKVKKVTGYAKTSSLTLVDYTPNEPYLYKLFDIRYTLNGAQGDSLNELIVTCAYYGDYYIGGKTYLYILRGDTFGYVEKPVGFSYPQNNEYALRHPDTETSATATTEKSTSPAQIALLVCLCLLVPVLAGLILRPPRRPPYEEE